MEEQHHTWGAFLATFGVSILLARLAGWSWDKVWRHYLAWIVICYAARCRRGCVRVATNTSLSPAFRYTGRRQVP